MPHYHAELAILRLHAGDWENARSEAEAGLTVTKQLNTPWLLHALALLARIAVSRGEMPAAAGHLDAAEAEIRTAGLIMGCNWVWWTRALLLEAQGRDAEAAESAARAWECLPELRFLHSNWLIAPDAVRLMLAAGDVERARSVSAQTRAAAERFGTASAAGAALRCRALVDGDARLAVEAAEACRQAPRPVDLACSREQAAVALAEAGRRDEARPLLAGAIAGYESVGAAYDVGRVVAKMRALGIRTAPRRSPARAASGWDALTRTELTVARLIAGGLSNPAIAAQMFISRYTVETHLKHIFAKLGLGSRAALAVEAERRGADSRTGQRGRASDT
jgi:DNA-binding CsgD family transcriptional regulator